VRRTLLLAALILGVVPATVFGTMPGSNGRIAFKHDSRIWTVNPDGTDERLVSETPSYQGGYDWSPDGAKLAFGSSEIYVVNADGSSLTNITNTPWGPFYEDDPSWSPDGTQIAYERFESGSTTEVWLANADGTNQHRLATSLQRSGDPQWHPDGRIGFLGCTPPPGGSCAQQPHIINPDGSGEQPLAAWGDFSPDGTKVVFQNLPPGASYPNHDIYVQNLDGSGRINLTNDPGADREPSWSPDGTKVVFRSGRSGGPRIYTMSADGFGGLTLVTNRAGLEPQWQPIHVDFYARPKGATPFLTYLVPAYAQCHSPDEVHGPPLGFGSCNPPVQSSSALTIGTGDANGQPAKSVSTVLLETLPGAPATPADEADVRATVVITDVYEQGSLIDYSGEVTAHLGLRITDKLNSGPGVAATVIDTSLAFDVPCAPTADAAVGATCAVQTTADALIPGAVPEGKRSIWALEAVAVDDAGGAPFLTQGVFVP
jgi:hypothetical protein